MKLTNLQLEMINDRLEIPECISEFLNIDQDEVESAIKSLLNKIKYSFELSWLSKIELLVLIDAIDGSTFEAKAESAVGFDISRQKYQAILRTDDHLRHEVMPKLQNELRVAK